MFQPVGSGVYIRDPSDAALTGVIHLMERHGDRFVFHGGGTALYMLPGDIELELTVSGGDDSTAVRVRMDLFASAWFLRGLAAFMPDKGLDWYVNRRFAYHVADLAAMFRDIKENPDAAMFRLNESARPEFVQVFGRD